MKGSPFLSHAFDASKVVVSNMPAGGMVGKPVTFDSKCASDLNKLQI